VYTFYLNIIIHFNLRHIVRCACYIYIYIYIRTLHIYIVSSIQTPDAEKNQCARLQDSIATPHAYIGINSCTCDEIKCQHPFFGLLSNEYIHLRKRYVSYILFTLPHEFMHRELCIFIYIILA